MKNPSLSLLFVWCLSALSCVIFAQCPPGALQLKGASLLLNPYKGINKGGIFEDESGQRWFVKETDAIIKSYVATQLVHALVDAGLGADLGMKRVLLEPRIICDLENGLASKELVGFKTQQQDPIAWKNAQGKLFWAVVIYLLRVIDLTAVNVGTVPIEGGYLATIIDFDIPFLDGFNRFTPEELMTGFFLKALMGHSAVVNSFKYQEGDYEHLEKLFQQLQAIPFSVLDNSITQSLAELEGAGYGPQIHKNWQPYVARVRTWRRTLLESLHGFNFKGYLLFKKIEECLPRDDFEGIVQWSQKIHLNEDAQAILSSGLFYALKGKASRPIIDWFVQKGAVLNAQALETAHRHYPELVQEWEGQRFIFANRAL